MILQMSIKESSSSRTLSSLFLILSSNDFFGSSLRKLGISFHNLAPILEKASFCIPIEAFMFIGKLKVQLKKFK